MNKYVIIFFFVFINTLLHAAAPREPKVYKATGNKDRDTKLCIARYKEELSYTSGMLKFAGSCNSKEIADTVDAISKILSEGKVDINDVASRYQGLMGKLAQCRMNEILREPSSASELKNNGDYRKIFLHVLGDMFGNNTTLEGNNSSVMLKHRLRILTALFDKFSNFTFINDEDQAQPCARIEGIIRDDIVKASPKPDVSPSLLKEMVAKTAQALRLHELSKLPEQAPFRHALFGSLNNLACNKSLFFPISWSKHAVVLSFTREDDEHVALRLYNSGDASLYSYHASAFLAHEEKYFPYVEHRRIPIKTLTSHIFLGALQEVSSPKGESTRPKDFYERYLRVLGGIRSETVKEPSHFEEPQLSGTCSYRNLPPVMKSLIHEENKHASFDESVNIALRIEYLINAITLRDFTVVFDKNDLVENEISRNLLRKGLVHFSGESLKALSKNTVTNDELTPVIELIHSMKLQLADIDELVANADKSRAPSLSTALAQSFAFPAIVDLPDRASIDFVKALCEKNNNNIFAPSTPLLMDLRPFDLSDKQQFCDLLVAYKDQIAQGLKNNLYLSLLDHVVEIARMLPLDTKSWAGINDDQVRLIIEHIAYFNEILLYSLARGITANLLPAHQVQSIHALAAIKFLAVADLLNQKFLTPFHEPIPSLYSETFGTLFSDNATITMQDLKWQEQFLILKTYFHDAKDADFFSLQKFPAGANSSKRIYEAANAPDELERLMERKKRVEDDLPMHDLEWIIKLLHKNKSARSFTSWYKWFSQQQEVIPYSFYWAGSSPDKPKIIPRDIPRNTEDLILRRAAIKFLGNQMPPSNIEIPIKYFRNLRSLSVAVNFMFTGDFSHDIFKTLAFNADFAGGISYSTTHSGEAQCFDGIASEDGFTLIKTTKYYYDYLELNMFSGSGGSSSNDEKTAIEVKSGDGKFFYRSPQLNLDAANGMLSGYTDSMKINRSLKDERNAACSVFYSGFHKFRCNISEAPTRLRKPPHQIIETDYVKAGLVHLGHERSRAFLNLSSKRSLQISQTLGYFSKNRHLLAGDHPTYRQLFYRLMLEPSLLLEEMSISHDHARTLSKRLASFGHEVFNYFLENRDYRAIAFILTMNDLFQNTAALQGVTDVGFLDAPKTIYETIAMLKPAQEQIKIFLYSALLQIYKNRHHLDTHDAANLIHAAIETNFVKLVEPSLLAENIATDITTGLGHVRKVLAHDADTILHKVLLRIKPELSDINKNSIWKDVDGKGTFFSTIIDGQEYSIDVVAGKMRENNNAIVTFPMQKHEYQEIFGVTEPMPSLATQIDDDAYEWIDPKTKDIVRANLSAQNKTFLRFNSPAWFVLIDAYVKSVTTKIHTSMAIMPSQHTWLQIQNRAFDQRIISTDRNTGAHSFVAELTLGEPQKITRLVDEDLLLNLEGTSLQTILTGLEHERHIYGWHNNHGTTNIELPRLGLVFKPLNNTDVDCASFIDYKLATTQFVEALGYPRNYIVCDARDEKSGLERIAIMVRQKLERTEIKSTLLTTNFLPNRDKDNFSRSFADDVFVYRINNDQKLEAQTTAGKFYLAQRFLWQQKYRAAKDLLMANRSEFGPYTTTEKEILQWISKGNDEDFDGRAFAVRLNASFLIGKNFYLYAEDLSNTKDVVMKDVFSKESLKTYDHYVQRLHALGEKWLDREVENKLGTWFPLWDSSLSQAMKNRSELVKYPQTKSAWTFNKGWLSDVDHERLQSRTSSSCTFKLPSLENLQEFLQKSPHKFKSILKSAHGLITPSTLPIFYNAAQGLPFSAENRNDAIEILHQALPETASFDDISDDDLRAELMSFANFACSRCDGYGYNTSEHVSLIAYMIYQISLQSAETKAQWHMLPWTSTKEREPTLKGLLMRGADEEPVAQKLFEDNLKNLTEMIAAQTQPVLPKTEAVNDYNFQPPKIKQRSYFVANKPVSNSLDDPLAKPILSDEEIALMFKEINTDDVKRKIAQQAATITGALTAVATKNDLSLDIATNIKALVKEIDDERIHNVKKAYVIKDIYAVMSTYDKLLVRINQTADTVDKYKSTILKILHAYNPRLKDANFFELHKLADMDKAAEINDVIYALLTDKIDDIYGLSGSLTGNDAYSLRDCTLGLLTSSTYLDQLKRAQKELLAVIAEKDCTLPQQQLAVVQAIAALKAKRAFTIADHIEYLVFEYFMDKLLRPNQKAILDELGIKKGQKPNIKKLGAVIESIMGSGKTSVIMLLLCLINSKSGFGNMIALPAAHVTAIAKEISSGLFKSARKEIVVMLFGKHRKLDEKSIKIDLEILADARAQGRTVVTTNESIKFLFLAYLNNIDNPTDDPVKNEQRKLLKLVLSHFHSLIIDEVDLALDILRAQQIAMGKRMPLSQVVKDTVTAIYQVMAIDPAIYKKYRLPFLAHSQGDPLRDENYPQLKNDLINALLSVSPEGKTFLSAKAGLESGFIALIKNDSTREKMRAYWNAITENSRKDALRAIADPIMKDVVAIVAEELNIILRLTLTKKLNIHYGPLPKPTPPVDKGESEQHYQNLLGEYEKSRFVSIPYQQGMPLVESRDAHPLEACNYTIQKDLELDNYEPFLRIELDHLKGLSTGDPNFARLYRRLVGDFASINIHDLDDALIAKIAKTAFSLPQKMRMINAHALDSISVFEKQYNTDTHIYEFLFPFVDAFSGTLWNAKTYPNLFTEAKLSNTTPYTILLLLGFESTVKVLKPTDLAAFIDQIYDGWKEPGSFIDQAGLLSAYAGKDVAQEMLRYTDGGVIFYDHANNKMILEKSGKIVPLTQTDVPIKNQIAYFDKQRSTATDVKLRLQMRAKKSVDRFTLFRDFAQGVWRLRGLDAGQKIDEYVLMEDDHTIIKQTLEQNYGLASKTLNTSSLITYALLYQEEQLGLLKWRAFESRLRNSLIAHAMAEINNTFDSQKIFTVFDKSRRLFSQSQPEHLYDVYGLPTMTRLKNIAVKLKIEEFKREPSYRYFNINDVIDKDWQRIAECSLPNLPDRVTMSSSRLHGTQVQIELNLNLQMEKQTQMNTHANNFTMDPSKRPPADVVYPWHGYASSESIFTEQFFLHHKAIVTMEESAEHAHILAPLFLAIDKAISFSRNLAPVNDKNFEFYYQHSKAINSVLVIFNRTSGQIKLIMIDLNDEDQWKSALLKNINDQDQRELEIALYDLNDAAVSMQSSIDVDTESLHGNRNFVELIAQVKFIAGFTNYRKAEFAALKKWIGSSSASSRVKELFRYIILAYKDDTMRTYFSSVIAELFGDN